MRKYIEGFIGIWISAQMLMRYTLSKLVNSQFTQWLNGMKMLFFHIEKVQTIMKIWHFLLYQFLFLRLEASPMEVFSILAFPTVFFLLLLMRSWMEGTLLTVDCVPALARKVCLALPENSNSSIWATRLASWICSLSSCPYCSAILLAVSWAEGVLMEVLKGRAVRTSSIVFIWTSNSLFFWATSRFSRVTRSIWSYSARMRLFNYFSDQSSYCLDDSSLFSFSIINLELQSHRLNLAYNFIADADECQPQRLDDVSGRPN